MQKSKFSYATDAPSGFGVGLNIVCNFIASIHIVMGLLQREAPSKVGTGSIARQRRMQHRVVLQVDGLDGSLGGVKYRTPLKRLNKVENLPNISVFNRRLL